MIIVYLDLLHNKSINKIDWKDIRLEIRVSFQTPKLDYLDK